MSDKMMITYEEFQELMASALKKNSSNEVEVTYHMFHKANMSYRAVSITDLAKDAGRVKVEPVFDMDKAYERYLGGESIDGLAKEMISFRNSDALPKPDSDMINDLGRYDLIKDRLIIRAVGRGNNKKFLANRPHRVFGDIAFVCYILLESSDKGDMSICITDEMMRTYKEQGVSFGQLFRETCRNSRNLCPPHIVDINEMSDIEMIPDDVKMYCVSNRNYSWGAGVIFYEGFLREFSNEYCSGGDLVIIPSSVHETIIMKYEPEKVSLEEMESIISSVNETLPTELILSYHLYYYEASSGFFGLACEKIERLEVI